MGDEVGRGRGMSYDGPVSTDLTSLSLQHIFLSYITEPRNAEAKFDIEQAKVAKQVDSWASDHGAMWRGRREDAGHKAFLASLVVGSKDSGEGGARDAGADSSDESDKDDQAVSTKAKSDKGDDEYSDGEPEFLQDEDEGTESDTVGAVKHDEGGDGSVTREVWDARDPTRRIKAAVLPPCAPVLRMTAKKSRVVSLSLVFCFLSLIRSQRHEPPCQRCVGRGLACWGGPGKACDACHADKAQCDFAANVGRGAARLKAEAGAPLEPPRRTRSATQVVRVDSPSSPELVPAKRRKAAGKRKSVSREHSAESVKGLRRTLKDLDDQIGAFQTLLNAMRASVSRAQDDLRDLMGS